MTKIHGIGLRSCTCDQCGKNFGNFSNLRIHVQEVHSEANVVCDICGQYFKSEHRLKEHKVTHLPKTIKCIFENCDCMFVSEGKLKAHIRVIHTQKKNTILHCEVCSKVFTRTSNLNAHIRKVHQGERPFKCDKCEFDTAYRTVLKEHKETVHDGVMYYCEVPGCGKQMNRIANINKHMKTAHGIPLPNERKSPKVYINDEQKSNQSSLNENQEKSLKSIKKSHSIFGSKSIEYL